MTKASVPRGSQRHAAVNLNFCTALEIPHRAAADGGHLQLGSHGMIVFQLFQLFQLFQVSNSGSSQWQLSVAALSLDTFFGFLYFNGGRLEGWNHFCFVLLEALWPNTEVAYSELRTPSVAFCIRCAQWRANHYQRSHQSAFVVRCTE